MSEGFPYKPPTQFSASFEGYTANPEDLEQWPNTVTVEATRYYDAGFDGEVTEEDEIYADNGAVRHLVKVDTNYKPTRPGNHPVHLTRDDAVKFAAAVLRAMGDTFSYPRCGQLRPAEAASLLHSLQAIDVELAEIREQALADLIFTPSPGDETEDDDTEPESAQEQSADEAPTTTATPAATEPTPKAPIPAWHGTWPAGGSTFDQEFAGALDEAFPGAAATIINSDAIGALAFKVDRRCQETDETPAQVLNSISADDRAFALRADNPAAFLASRIES